MILADDDHDILQEVVMYGNQTSVTWISEISDEDSEMFEDFSDELKINMLQKDIVLHAHTYAIPLDAFKKYDNLKIMKPI